MSVTSPDAPPSTWWGYGSGLPQLTRRRFTFSGEPGWSPNGRLIVLGREIQGGSELRAVMGLLSPPGFPQLICRGLTFGPSCVSRHSLVPSALDGSGLTQLPHFTGGSLKGGSDACGGSD